MHDGLLGHLRDVRGSAQNTVAGVVKQMKPFLAWARADRGQTLAVDPAKLKVKWEDIEKVWPASTLANDSTVQLTGDLSNAGTLASAGTLLFSGTANQVLTPGAASVAILVLNNTGPVGQRTLSL